MQTCLPFSKKTFINFLQKNGIIINTHTKARGHQGIFFKNRIDVSKKLDEKRSIEVSYEVGDTVNIMDGIMDGFSGVVQEIDLENNMVKVTVSAFFGRETLVELELDQVEPVTD